MMKVAKFTAKGISGEIYIFRIKSRGIPGKKGWFAQADRAPTG